MPEMNVRVRIRWVGRKFREVGRTVIILRALVEPRHLQIPAGVHFEETQVSIVRHEDSANGAVSGITTSIETHVCVTGNGPDGGTGDGMRWWVSSPGGTAARNMWMRAIQLRKDAIEDRVFEETRA